MAGQSLSLLEALPLEIQVHIFCDLPEAVHALALSITSKHMRAVLTRNEGIIAREIARTTIKDDNLAGVKLAFMAAEVRFIDRTSPEAVSQFCDTYVHHEPWRLDLYRLCVLPTIRRTYSTISNFVKWGWTKQGLPLVDTPREMSATEAARQARFCYILETGFALLELLPEQEILPSPRLKYMIAPAVFGPASAKTYNLSQPLVDLAKRFWRTFSHVELDVCRAMLQKLNCLTMDTQPVVSIDKIYVHFEIQYLVEELSFVRLNYLSHMRVCTFRGHCIHHLCTYAPYTNYPRAVADRDNRAFALRPFIEDPKAFLTPDTYDWLAENTGDTVSFLYHPFFRRKPPTGHIWLFLIGDKERCEEILSNKPVWEFKPAEGGSGGRRISWLRDVSRFEEDASRFGVHVNAPWRPYPGIL
ncbi:hypothetical protein F5Y19DRAFT_484554 [Xylariaceae sp. FL1651]|nr:hypothetical protein F5Y19DRAFT_484554 [Xylariaceae sp. FL1651]